MKNQETFTLPVESLAFEGKGITKLDGKVLFVRNALPGDIVEVKILRNKKNYAEAELLQVIEKSPNRIEPVCKHFGICGGCSFQNLDYTSQLIWKMRFIEDSFEKISKTDKIPLNFPIPSSQIFSYRNKTEFSFGASRWLTNEEIANIEKIENKNFALGFYLPNRFDKVLDIEECFLHPVKANKILNLIKNKAIELSLPAYNLKNHTGFLRNLVFRYSYLSNELMAILIVTNQIGVSEESFLDWFKFELTKESINHLILAFNDSYSPSTCGKIDVVKGENFLLENILGFQYKISPFSFFQVNPYQIENLVQKVIEFAQSKNKIVWDLYCGAGTFSLPLSRESSLVIGIELSTEAIDDAKENAKVNNIKNVIFHKIDLHHRAIGHVLKEFDEPDVVIVDPPRSGLHKNLVEALLQIKPKKIVYVSCNPTTQARDYLMMKSSYKIKELQPIDMFPQTYHIESIALLEKI